MTPLATLAAALAFTLLWLAWKTLQATAARKTTRAAYFNDISAIFDSVTTRVEPTGLPRMTGKLGPHAFDIQAVQDSLTFRKLPALWVMLTLPEPMQVKATLDIMARPTGQEPFSHFARLPQSLPAPAPLSDDIAIRSDNAAEVPPLAAIAPHLELFADPKVKELVISPKGLRLVILAEEAGRGRYLIFREAELGKTPLDRKHLIPLIDALLALRQSLIEAT
ncbi:MAG: hypothetical protein K9G43_05495 [Rhodobacteraceae bacterium]|nr:hypothetical protein [Paracoccaceae bacterium]